MDRYEKMTDEQLIQKLRDGDNRIVDYIMEKYKNLVRKEANAMYLLGGENEDPGQEGMIGLFKAVQNYEPNQNSSFSASQNCVFQTALLRNRDFQEKETQSVKFLCFTL